MNKFVSFSVFLLTAAHLEGMHSVYSDVDLSLRLTNYYPLSRNANVPIAWHNKQAKRLLGKRRKSCKSCFVFKPVYGMRRGEFNGSLQKKKLYKLLAKHAVFSDIKYLVKQSMKSAEGGTYEISLRIPHTIAYQKKGVVYQANTDLIQVTFNRNNEIKKMIPVISKLTYRGPQRLLPGKSQKWQSSIAGGKFSYATPENCANSELMSLIQEDSSSENDIFSEEF
ncbi:MAG: hypothetical protein LBB63_04265 [Holosporaceae bacterium]|nr:hypothetical protein [Holosporaceae bacterium]